VGVEIASTVFFPRSCTVHSEALKSFIYPTKRTIRLF